MWLEVLSTFAFHVAPFAVLLGIQEIDSRRRVAALARTGRRR